MANAPAAGAPSVIAPLTAPKPEQLAGGDQLLRADALLGHLGAGRISLWPDLEQFGNSLRRPDDIEALECIGKIIDRCGGDAPDENAGERRACTASPA